MAQSIPLILQEDLEQGGKEYEEGIENDFAYRNNVKQASKEVRLGFIRKVYSLLAFQLVLTVIIAAVCMFTPPIKEFIHRNDWLMMVAMFSSFGLLLALHIKRRDTPANFILLTAFTVVLAYSLGVTITYFEKAVVLQALALTVLIVAGLTIFTFQTKYDLSSMHSILFAGLLILLVGGIMQIFMQSTVFEIILSLGGAFLFSIFIIVDTQMIMEKLSAEDDWLMMVAMFSSFGLLLALHIKRRDTPANFILLTAFTVVLAYSLGVTITYFEKAVVLQALAFTVLIVAGLTIFTFQTKYDLSSMHSILFAGLLILLVGGIMQIFMQSTVFEIILSLGGAFLFSIFIIVDTQMIMEKLSAEEYILATINLYLDIVNLFIYLLRLLEALRQ